MLGFGAGGGKLGSTARTNRGGRERAHPRDIPGLEVASPRLDLEAVAAVTQGRGSGGRSAGGGRWWTRLRGKTRARGLKIYGIELGVRRCAEEGASFWRGGGSDEGRASEARKRFKIEQKGPVQCRGGQRARRGQHRRDIARCRATWGAAGPQNEPEGLGLQWVVTPEVSDLCMAPLSGGRATQQGVGTKGSLGKQVQKGAKGP